MGSAERTGFLTEIADGLVRLHREYYGRGPIKVKTYRVNDAVISLLEGGFTTVERTLIDEGRSESVRDVRRSFQAAMEDRFREVVEKATGRRIAAYMSQIHTDPDVAMEFFLLEPSDRPVSGESDGYVAAVTDQERD
jgi:uncharacterized protein YbcI